MSPQNTHSSRAIPAVSLFGGIGARLLLLAGIPTLLLIVFAGLGLNDQRMQAQALARVALATELSVQLGALAHEILIERGLTAGFSERV